MKIDVLDYGYVEFIEDWGWGKVQLAEAGIIEAARMSTGKAFNGWEHDKKLLTYLYTNKHMTPFEMAGITLEIQAPIFVFREWHRHRTQSYNEMSARYIPLPDVNYVPSIQRLKATSSTNKQAQGVKEIAPDIDLSDWLNRLKDLYAEAQRVYEQGLEHGIPKEIARLPVPVARYSRMRASANLRNWLAFLTLRMDTNAQWEIRQFAHAVAKIIENRFPQTFSLFLAEFYHE